MAKIGMHTVAENPKLAEFPCWLISLSAEEKKLILPDREMPGNKAPPGAKVW